MPDKEKTRKPSIGEMHKRSEKMADERRYIIYYTFGETEELPSETTTKSEATKNV